MRKFLFNLFGKLSRPLFGRGLSGIPGIVWLYAQIYKVLSPKGIGLREIEGCKMYVDYSDLVMAPVLSFTGTWEPFETSVFKAAVEKDMTVLDIGANIGYYTLLAARAVGESGRVLAFEPSPESFSLLVRNIEINGLSNVTPVQKAVSDELGRARLFLNRTNKGASRLSKPSGGGFVEVDTITLDEFLGSDRIDLVKMDIEGWEPAAFAGMKRILLENPRLKLFTEFSPRLLEESGFSPHAFFNELQNCFRVYILDEKRKESVPARDFSEVKERLVGGFINLFCIRNG